MFMKSLYTCIDKNILQKQLNHNIYKLRKREPKKTVLMIIIYYKSIK